MAKPWSAVASSGAFQALPAEQQEAARQQYFETVVAPNAPADQIEDVRAQFDADTRIAKRDLPADVKASSAGGGRGSVNPTSIGDQGEDLSKPSFRGPSTAQRYVAPKRESVLEDVIMPPPTVTPDMEAENVRLSDRGYAERTPDPLQPPRAVMTEGARQKPNQAEDLGRVAGDDGFIGRSVSQAKAGFNEGAYGALRAGAEAVKKNPNALPLPVRAVGAVVDAASRFSGGPGMASASEVAGVAGESAQAARDFQQGMGKPSPIIGFSPRSPINYLQEQGEGAASSLGQSAALALTLGPRAVIPLLSLQSAGQQYQQARTQGKTPGEALANALPYGAFEALGEKVGGLDKAARALNIIAKGGTREELHTAADMLVHAGIREIPGEVVTYLGQSATDLLPGIGLNPNLSVPEFLDGLRDTVIQSAMMAGTTAGGGVVTRSHADDAAGARQQPKPLSAEEIARAKGFLVQQERIKALSGQGEKEVAGVLQRRLDAEQAETELQGLADKPYGADPDFQQRYRTLRSAGTKPAEASSRAAMASGFAQMAEQAGLTPKAIDAAQEASAKMPLDEVPAFLERYTAGLNAGGMGTPVPQGVVSGAVGAVGDDAMNTAVDNIARLLGATAEKPTETPAAASVSKTAESDPQTALTATNEPQAETPAPVTVADLPPNEAGAHAGASSPLNDKTATKAQILADNAPLGHMVLGKGAEGGQAGVSIENAAGSERIDLHNEPPQWRTPMEHGYHYGRFKGTTGADGDHVDGFFAEGLPEDYAGPVFVVDQYNKDGSFDEHKVLVGPHDKAQALADYNRHYEPGWDRGHAVTRMEWPQFQKWVHDEKATSQPAAAAAAPDQAPAGTRAPQQHDAAGSRADRADDVRAGDAPAAAVAKQAKAADLKRQMIDLRKRTAVLRALLECVKG